MPLQDLPLPVLAQENTDVLTFRRSKQLLQVQSNLFITTPFDPNQIIAEVRCCREEVHYCASIWAGR